MKSIELYNFRCFRHLAIDFSQGINLLIGDNASGKTSLLWACKYAINSFFSGFSDVYTRWSSPVRDDFRRVVAGEKRMPTQSIRIDFSFFEDEFKNHDGYAPGSVPLSLICKSEKNSRPLISGLSHLRDYGKALASNSFVSNTEGRSSQETPLPVFVSYSTHGIHKRQKVVSKYFNETQQLPSFGYYMCQSTDGLMPHWVRRLMILTEADGNPVERAIVIDALRRMFGTEGCGVIKDFDIRVNLKDVVCIFLDGRETPSAQLSDGYRRLFSIVIDIAFRCALLNSVIYGMDAALKSQGTVIIDEIDLHLHPSLQAVVLKALQTTFPSLQFIVSSHAPMTMSGVEDNERNRVLYMAYENAEDYGVSQVDTFGMDISTLAETVLGVPSRNPEVKKEIDTLSGYIDDERYDEAKKLLVLLKAKFGDRIPELSGFDTQIAIEDALR